MPPAATEPPVQLPPPLPGSPAPKRRLPILIAVIIIAVAVLAAGGFEVYAYHQKSVATKKVNELADQLWKQEKTNAVNYFNLANTVDSFGNDLAQAFDSTSASKDIGQADLAKLKSEVSAICSIKGQLTADQLKSQTNDLKLNAAQQKFISDWQSITSNLAATDFSPGYACKDGQLISYYADNWGEIFPAIASINQLSDSQTSLSSAQLSALKSAKDASLVHPEQMQKYLPANTTLLNDMKAMAGDLYDEAVAVQRSDESAAVSALSKLEADGAKVDKDLKAAEDEVTALNAQQDKTIISTSQAEINAINYQSSQGSHAVKSNFDATLAAARIVETEVSSYSDNHDGAYPNAQNIDELASVIPSVKELSNKGLLKNVSYTSLGSDQSGFNFNATLKDGTKLSEKMAPTSEQS